VIGIVGGTVTAAARQTGHYISFAVTLAMMLGLTAYIYYHSRSRYGTHWHKYGPTYITILSTLLVMADLTRHVLADLGWWTESQGAGEYKSGCGHEDIGCLSTTGILFTIVFTYTGFILLAVATLWNANICEKMKDIKAEWKRLRGQRSATVP